MSAACGVCYSQGVISSKLSKDEFLTHTFLAAIQTCLSPWYDDLAEHRVSPGCVCVQDSAAAAQSGWEGLRMSQIINGTSFWTGQASRDLSRDSHSRGGFFTAGEVAKGVQAFHGNVLSGWLPETESFATIIICIYCLMAFLLEVDVV